MNILAISGSLRSASSNTALLRAMVNLAPEGVSISFYERLADIPTAKEQLVASAMWIPERDILRIRFEWKQRMRVALPMQAIR